MPQFVLPDILKDWPWTRAINPHYAECAKESQAWSDSFHAFSPRTQLAFNMCYTNLLASLAYPRASRDQCRITCDLMYLYGVFDEYSDAMDPNSIGVWVEIIMDALWNPERPRPVGEPVIGEITRSFWINAIKHSSRTSQKRFISEFELFARAVQQEAHDRAGGLFRDANSYMAIRRDTVGTKPSFALLEMDMELPEEVFGHHSLATLRNIATDMILLANDMYSFNNEQARGDIHNLVTLMMLHENMDVQQAMDYVSSIHDGLVDQFHLVFKQIPSFDSPEIDQWVQEYADGLGNWIRANECWSFESWRYFKNDGRRVQKERTVELLPRGAVRSMVSPNEPGLPSN